MLDSWLIEKLKELEKEREKRPELTIELPQPPQPPLPPPPQPEAPRGVTIIQVWKE